MPVFVAVGLGALLNAVPLVASLYQINVFDPSGVALSTTVVAP